ncbi:MAG: hypothetical protein IKR48_01120 [Kiritimatiellae bacterium]|nr:hypothetical protein [Kiritimatiellia bacterium]
MKALLSGWMVLLLAAFAMAEEWRFEVCADAPRVVSCQIDKKVADSLETNGELAAVGKDGSPVSVPWVLDKSGKTPELVWLADGRRSFVVRPKQSVVKMPLTDLAVSAAADGAFLVRTSFFDLQHPAKGKGGFPERIRFPQSGQGDDSLYFLDRVVRRNAKGGLEQFRVDRDADAVPQLLLHTPLRSVIEVRTRAESVRIVYRYIYTAWSPTVRVDVSYEQDKRNEWLEVHTMHASWNPPKMRYPGYLTSGKDQIKPIQKRGEKSRNFGGSWAVYTDGTNAVGITSSVGVGGWDASNEFVYYIVAERDGWGSQEMDRSCLLYFGPLADGKTMNRWFSLDSSVRVFCNDRPWVPVEPLAIPPYAVVLEGKTFRIAFDSEERGFNCLGMENRMLSEPVSFGKADPEKAAFWTLRFWRDGDANKKLDVNNLAPGQKTVTRNAASITFKWERLSLEEDNGVLDVSATVALNATGDAAEWRLSVANRSTHWGLAETEFPVITHVVPQGVATAMLPLGNWGGRLFHQYRRGDRMLYPSSQTTSQTLAFLLGAAGLQITALDGLAQEKVFDTRGSALRIRYRCPDAGQPGAANAPDFAVETAAFTGDWWQAAKRYRAWATRQKWTSKGPLAKRADFSRKLGDAGLWMILGNTPQEVSNSTARVLAAFPDIPVAVHWYNWHQIPFDNSYPEYFPEKPGMKEVVSWMKSKGVLVMPYINARLWDQDIPSFSNAIPAACKKEDGRSFYVERYGSGRNLVPMCPVTKLWRDRVGSICERLINEIGVNAIYLDQVAAAHPAACHDRTHGHPLGGGAYWTEGYRELMKPIRDLAVRKGGVALTTECTAEPYTDSFDAYLAWFARSAEDIPFLPAVYSGYTVYFSSPQDSHDSLDSFCAMQGRDFLWGCQLGWNPPWILDAAHEGHRAFTVRLCRERLTHKQFFLEGELMGELPTPPGFPTVEVNWHRKPSVSCRMPAVMGTVWRDAEGKRSCVCLVNVSGEEQTFPYRLNGTDGRATLPPRSVKTIEAVGNVAKREPF